LSPFSIDISKQEVKTEFDNGTERFHFITCWVGIVLNLIWAISDYVVFPERFSDFLVFRALVSISTLFILLFKHKIKNGIYFCLFYLVLGISIQNAYMWSLMDAVHFKQHTFAYIALFIGVGMLVLWEIWYSVLLFIATLISNFIFIKINSELNSDDFLINGGLLTITVALFSVFLIRSRYRLTIKEIKSRLELSKSKELLQEEHNTVIHQKKEIEEKNTEIVSSIRYAKRIQFALLPPEEKMNEILKEYFVFYQPKDIVSGDFYWATKVITTRFENDDSEIYLIAVADCTGHGVPGAFMSLIGNNFLKQSVKEKSINTPAQALDFLNANVVATLNQHTTDAPVRDGMDISLVAIEFATKKLQYAGANNPIYILRNKELIILKPDKQAIGSVSEELKAFTNHEFDLQTGDLIYMFTDGYADQFGGPDGKKLKYKKFQDHLITVSEIPMYEQKNYLKSKFDEWRGTTEQTDDVCVVGIKIT
jgi:serine phosphatase RsbU (regulator of sigma subunit)